jgi:hypothetical protein
LTLRIGDGEQITVGIIAELRHAVDGVGQLRSAIERIRHIDRLLPKGINDAAEPPRGIEHPFRLTIQEIFDGDEIAELIGERGDVVQRIFDREWLALLVHREGRDFAECVGTEEKPSGACCLSPLSFICFVS